MGLISILSNLNIFVLNRDKCSDTILTQISKKINFNIKILLLQINNKIIFLTSIFAKTKIWFPKWYSNFHGWFSRKDNLFSGKVCTKKLAHLRKKKQN